MNRIQVELEKYRRAAHLARFEPSGKPFKAACDMIESLERTLRSIAQTDPTLAKSLAQEALNGTKDEDDEDDVEDEPDLPSVARKRSRKVRPPVDGED